MTYDAREISVQDGRPVEIYTFARDAQRWRFTSADRIVIVAGEQFAPAAISRTGIESTPELARAAMTLTVPHDFAVSALWRVVPPSSPVTCQLQQYHEGDGELASLWSGRVIGVRFEGSAVTMTMEPVFTSIRRMGLRRLYQRSCPHVLYGAKCGANRALFKVAGTVTAISGFVVTMAMPGSNPNGYFAGGYLEFVVAAATFERRFITDHTGAALTLSTSPHGLVVGAAVDIFPGCDHTLATCNTKFANAANFGGFPFFPAKNPFGGDPIF